MCFFVFYDIIILGDDIMELIQENLIQLFISIIIAVASWLGVQIKNAYVKYIDTKTKKEIVKATVEYVEQISKSISISSENKFNKAKEKALEWLNEKGIKISDTELEILIESAVQAFNKEINK